MKQKEALAICQNCNAKCCRTYGTDCTEKELQRIKNSGFKTKVMKLANNHYWIKSDRKGVCQFLDSENKCRIWKIKPAMCSSWPIIPKQTGKKQFWVLNCALAEKLNEKELADMKKKAAAVPSDLFRCYWNKAGFSGKREKEAAKTLSIFKKGRMSLK